MADLDENKCENYVDEASRNRGIKRYFVISVASADAGTRLEDTEEGERYSRADYVFLTLNKDIRLDLREEDVEEL